MAVCLLLALTRSPAARVVFHIYTKVVWKTDHTVNVSPSAVAKTSSATMTLSAPAKEDQQSPLLLSI